MVAQPAALKAAGGSSGEEPASGTSPEPEQQEQAASSLETMMSHLLQEFGGVREDVRRISVRTEALEGALADVSLSGSGGPPNGSGSMSATPMGAASAERLERAPDQGPSRDGASHAQEDGDDAATASGVVAAATATGARGEQIADGGDEAAAAAEAAAGGPRRNPRHPAHLVSASAGGTKLVGPSGEYATAPLDRAEAVNIDSAAEAAAEEAAAAAAAAARAKWRRREQLAQIEADSQSANVTGQARSGDTSNESGPGSSSPSQDGSLPADVPSGSAEEEHSDSEEPLSRGLAEFASKFQFTTC